MRDLLSNFYKAAILLFGAILIAFSARAQQVPFELLWRTGTVYLTSGDSVSGQVSLVLPTDIVSVKQPDGTVSAFATVNVTDFVVREEQNSGNFRPAIGPLEIERYYKTYMWDHNKDYSNFLSPAFFVVVQPGVYTLLMRETKAPMPVQVNRYANANSMGYRTEKILQYFYLAKPNNEIIPLRNPRKDLQTLFPKLKNDLVTFAKTNKLDFDEPLELARIIEYCNRSI